MSPFAFRPPIWLEETASTNTYVKECLTREERPPRGLVVAARRQTQGRGRMGNAWLSSPGQSLTFSFLWRPENGPLDPLRAGTLPQAVALAVADLLGLHGASCRIRWPNDVLAPGGKICGILAESSSARDGSGGLVVGVGLNIRADSALAARVGQPVANLEAETGLAPAPEDLLPELLRSIVSRVAAWETGGFAAIQGDLVRLLWGMGEEVTVRAPGGVRKTGGIVGLGADGELLLRGADGVSFGVNSVAGLEGFGDTRP